MAQKWPKKRLVLNKEEKSIADDWMQWFHVNVLPKTGSRLDSFDHTSVIKLSDNTLDATTLEIGCGTGSHLDFEPTQTENKYYVIDIRDEMINLTKKRYPNIKQAVCGDCQKEIPFPSSFFDRVIAIQTLEHLNDLPAALKEIHRVLKKNGRFIISIPMERKFLHMFARTFFSVPIFIKRYGLKLSYFKLMRYEHINNPQEILDEIDHLFTLENKIFYPFNYIPFMNMNLLLSASFQPKKL